MVSAMYVYCFSIIMDIAFFTICIQQKTGGTGARQAVSFGTYSWLGATNMAAGPNIMELSGIPKVLFVTWWQPWAGPGRGGSQHLVR